MKLTHSYYQQNPKGEYTSSLEIEVDYDNQAGDLEILSVWAHDLKKGTSINISVIMFNEFDMDKVVDRIDWREIYLTEKNKDYAY